MGLALVKNGLELFTDKKFIEAVVDAYETKNFDIVRKLWKFADDIPALVKYPETQLLGTVLQKYEAKDQTGSYYELAAYKFDHAEQ